MRKIDINNINLEVKKVEFLEDSMLIVWSSNIGFGQYVIDVEDDQNLIGYSETMDSNEDKEFITKLFSLIVEKLNIK